ncbi:MAG: hypothetical protein CMQ24_18965 [Gammaproteobacteria bacterium]|nr:hypothetical protein [Gammaproteobacteria bacterium]
MSPSKPPADDFDPDAVPIRPAATVMLVDDRPDLQVFMMERHANTVFAGGMWVFPGGAVDTSDDAAAYEARCAAREAVDANRLLELEDGALRYYVAAIREAFEECGLMLSLHADSGDKLELTSDGDIDRFQEHRDALNAGDRSLLEILERENLLMDAGDMHYIARWITPLGSPRRFDARFFIARVPRAQTPAHDNQELVHSDWFRPQDVLDAFDREEMVLMTPTLRMVRSLARFGSADEVIAAASSNLPDERVRVVDGRLVLPGDPGYEHADQNIENGWVRLRPG